VIIEQWNAMELVVSINCGQTVYYFVIICCLLLLTADAFHVLAACQMYFVTLAGQ